MEKNRKQNLSSQGSWLSMELENGKVRSYFPMPNNSITTKNGTGYLSLEIFIFCMTNPSFLTLIATIMVILLYKELSPYSIQIYVIQFLLLLASMVTKKILFNANSRKSQKSINSRKVTAYRGEAVLEGLQWKQLRAGDIVYLLQGEIVPADILLLDSQEIEDRTAITYIDTRMITGDTTITKKYCCYLTQMVNRGTILKRNWNNYRTIINGKLNFEKSSDDLSSFKGYLKMTKDPKVEKLSINNLVLRESIIKTSLWVYGLVVYAGMDTKIMKIKESSPRPSVFMRDKLNILFLFALCCNIAAGIGFSIEEFFKHSRLSSEVVMYEFLLYSLVLPHMAYVGRNVYFIFLGIISNINNAGANNFDYVKHLGEIDFAMIVANSSGKLVIDEIVTSSSIYQIKTQYTSFCEKPPAKIYNRATVFSSIIQKNSRRGGTKLMPFMNVNNAKQLVFGDTIEQKDIFEIDDCAAVTGVSNRLKVSAVHYANARLKAQLQPLRLDKTQLLNCVKADEEQSREILKAFALCNRAKLFYNPQKENYIGVSSLSYEEALLALVRYMGWEITPKMDLLKVMGLTIKEEKEKFLNGQVIFESNKKIYEWIGINTFKSERKLYSIVVREGDSIVLYCKGKPEDIVDRLHITKETQKIIDTKLAEYNDRKAEVYIYTKRVLSAAEKEVYENEYANLKYSLATSEHQIEQFSKDYESNLEFICIVALSNQILPGLDRLLGYLVDSGTKICTFSANYTEANLLKSSIEELRGEDIFFRKSSQELIQYYLAYTTQKMANGSNFKYRIVLDGDAWESIYQEKNLLQHFLFILYHCECLFAYNFQPQSKACLATCLRDNYNRRHSILTVIGAYCDLRLASCSDVSIQLNSDLPADMRVQSLDKIIKLFEMGPCISRNIRTLIHFITCRVILIFSTSMFFGIWLNQHGIQRPINSLLVLLMIIVNSLVDVGYTLYLGKNFEKLDKPILYADFKTCGNRCRIMFFKSFLYGLIIPSCLLLCLRSVRLSQGRFLPIEALDMALFIQISLLNPVKCFFDKQPSFLTVFFNFFINITILSVGMVLGILKNYENYKLVIVFQLLFTNFSSISILINVLLFCLALGVFIDKVLLPLLFPTLLQKYGQKYANNQIKDQMASEYSNKELVEHLLKNQQKVDSSMKEVSQADLNSLKITILAQIKNQQSNLKYLFDYQSQLMAAAFKTLTFLVISLVFLFIYQIISNNYLYLDSIFNLISLVFTIILMIYIKISKPQMSFYWIIEIALFILNSVLIAYTLLLKNQLSYLYFGVIFLIMTQPVGARLIVVIGLAIEIVTIGTTALFTFGAQNQLGFSTICIMAGSLVNLQILRDWMIMSRKSFLIRENFQRETNHINDILGILVPKFVKQHIQKNYQDASLEQEQNKVSILFSYVCDFDEIVGEEGQNVVLLMDQLFRQFDQVCHNFAVQKIETVGMTYMAATGIKAYQDGIQNQMKYKNPVERLLNMGIQMLEKAKGITWGFKKNKRINIKIGIHHGNVIVGVIGYHKPQFSLIGDAVNTTSRHCASGGPGDISISQVAYRMIKRFPIASFSHEQRKMKGLGEVTVYKYLKNQESQSHLLKVKLRFRGIVNRVIADLKAQGKIKYKRFKASQITENMLQIGNFRMNSKKYTQKRSTMNFVNLSDYIQTRNSSTVIQNNKKDFELQYNMFLEQPEFNPRYQQILIKTHCSKDRMALMVTVIIILAEVILQMSQGVYQWIDMLMSVVVLLKFLMVVFYNSGIQKNWVSWLFAFIFVFDISINKLKSFQLGYYFYLYSMIMISFFTYCVAFRFTHTVFVSTCAVLINIVLAFRDGQLDLGVILEMMYLGLTCQRKYETMQQGYKKFSQMVVYERKAQEQSGLVSQLLPKHAYEKLKNQNNENRLILTDKFDNCTLLFADIKGFTAFSNRNTPQTVVKMLRELFEEFDKLCLDNKVYKVYTIGDCYVVLGFINCYQRNILQQAKNVVNMGLAMIETIQKVRQNIQFPELDMRIGVHTGTIIGGIIGTEVVRYDIYGSDVMVANKFEENGKIGAIHISESTKEILDSDQDISYNIQPYGTVRIEKLNAQFPGYLISKKKFDC